MIKYLSLDWLEALTKAVESDAQLKKVAAGRSVGFTQVVSDGPEGTVTYHLQVTNGNVLFGAGAADPEDVRFEQSWETTVAIAQGSIDVQNAFIRGQIRLYGDKDILLQAQDIFGALNRVFDQVRQITDYSA